MADEPREPFINCPRCQGVGRVSRSLCPVCEGHGWTTRTNYEIHEQERKELIRMLDRDEW